MFTRTFIGSFEDDPEVISAWLESSVGVQQGSKKLQPDGSTEYHLKPGGGAMWAELIVSPDGRVVRFKAYWS
jgi:hypothetical protein